MSHQCGGWSERDGDSQPQAVPLHSADALQAAFSRLTSSGFASIHR